ASWLVAVALWREGKPRTAALANADVKKALELIRVRVARFPDEATEWEWAMLRASNPDEAERLATAMKSNELLRVERALQKRISAPSLSTALRQCWALDAAGKTDEGREVLRRCTAEGMQLPFDLP